MAGGVLLAVLFSWTVEVALPEVLSWAGGVYFDKERCQGLDSPVRDVWFTASRGDSGRCLIWG